MNIQDKIILKTWLVTGASLAEVEQAESIGFVGNVRFTEQARRAYILLWSWSDWRFGGKAACMQERLYNKTSIEFLRARIARTKLLVEHIKREW